MKLTRASSYALHAVMYMASQKDKDGPIPSHLIAHDRGIPERFLLKVLKPLVVAQLLHSIKGPHGGYRLARPAREITVLDIIEAVDGPIRGGVPQDDFDTFRKRCEDQETRLTVEQLRKQFDKVQTFNRRLEQFCTPAAESIRKQLERVKISDLISK
jgi:Rrf2 family protein